MKGTVLGDKEQGVGIRDKGKTEVELDTEDQVLFVLLLHLCNNPVRLRIQLSFRKNLNDFDQKSSGPKNVWVKKDFVQKNIFDEQNLVKNNWGPKTFFDENF